MGRKEKQISLYQLSKIDSVLFRNGGPKVTLQHGDCKSVQLSACIQQREALNSRKS